MLLLSFIPWGKITKLEQMGGENVENFASRIRAIAGKIWGSNLTNSEGDQLCFSVFLGGIKRPEIKGEIIRSTSSNSFEEAVQVAIAAESIYFVDKQTKDLQQQQDLLAAVNRIESRYSSSPPNYSAGGSTQNHEELLPRDIPLHASVNRIDNRQHRPNSSNGRQNQQRSTYRRETRTCHLCNEVGHLLRDCPELPKCLNYLRAGSATGPSN